MTDHNMILAYRAKDDVEAAQLVQALEAAGIRTARAGGQARIGFGELGPDALLVDIWVPRTEALLTRRTIENFQSSESTSRTEWTCTTCGEDNSGGFELCWSCQTSRD